MRRTTGIPPTTDARDAPLAVVCSRRLTQQRRGTHFGIDNLQKYGDFKTTPEMNKKIPFLVKATWTFVVIETLYYLAFIHPHLKIDEKAEVEALERQLINNGLE